MPVDPKKIKRIVVHHTATPLNATFDFVKQIGIDRGFGDISYNVLITSDGRVHKGRPLSATPAHCKADGANYDSIGIALTGDFTITNPTQAQLKSLDEVLLAYNKQYGLTQKDNYAHCEIPGASTACPGVLKNWVVKYRQCRTREQLIRLIKKIIWK